MPGFYNLGNVKPHIYRCLRKRAHAVRVSRHLISATWAYVWGLWMRTSSPAKRWAGCWKGLGAERARWFIQPDQQQAVVKVRRTDATSSDGLHLLWVQKAHASCCHSIQQETSSVSEQPEGWNRSATQAAMRGWGVAVNHPPKNTASDYLNKIWHMPHSLMPAYDKWSGNLITHAAPCGTYLNISPCSSFIISPFKALIAFLLSHSILPLIDLEKNTFVNYFYQLAPEINPHKVTGVFWNAWAGMLNFKCYLLTAFHIWWGNITWIFYSAERGRRSMRWVFISLCISHLDFKGLEPSYTHAWKPNLKHTRTCS